MGRFELDKLKEKPNEFVRIGRVRDCSIIVGIAEKNNKQSAQIRLVRGLTTIAKIRGEEDIEVIKTFIDNINKIENILKQICEYNNKNKKKSIDFDILNL